MGERGSTSTRLLTKLERMVELVAASASGVLVQARQT